VESLRAGWTRPEPVDFDPNDVVWQAIAARMEQPAARPVLVRSSRPASSPRAPKFAPSHRMRMLPAAAAVLFVVGLGSYMSFRSHLVEVPMREVASGRGQRAAVELPDGSRAVLAPESRLRFAADLGTRNGARALYLQGEAYFEARHDRSHPFLVHAGEAVIEDIGTEFVIASQPEKHGVEVVVVTGSVALHPATDPASHPLVTLKRGDRAYLDSSRVATVTRNVNLAPYTGWIQGNLVFDATPLQEAIPELARWYDLEVRISDPSLARRKLTASFSGEPVTEVLEMIARSLDARVLRDGRMVVLSPKNHSRSENR
jgi:transmembrane sensor